VAVEFREPPWSEEVAAKLERVAFLRTPGSPFQTWWTAYPLRVPLLVAWAGGPAAVSLAGRGPAELGELAVTSLAASLGLPRRRLAARFVAAWSHDWRSDPYARGAYGYVRVGGVGSARRLARPVAGTLFFAGEATDEEQMGTVEGAIASGLRAARQVERALRSARG
jgi:monoamine oxidase